MRYQLTKQDDRVNIEFEGVFNALELIMLLQSQVYKTAFSGAKKFVMDVTRISTSELSDEDVHCLALLGKLGSPKAQNLHLVIVADPHDTNQIVTKVEQIFAEPGWKVDIAESLAQADRVLS